MIHHGSSFPFRYLAARTVLVFLTCALCVAAAFVVPDHRMRCCVYQPHRPRLGGVSKQDDALLPSENDKIATSSNDIKRITVPEVTMETTSTDTPFYPPPEPELTSADMMQALGTSPRRVFLSLLSGTGIALAGNLFGVTSLLLQNVDEGMVEATGLDTYFPRGDFKRYRTADYTFVIPKEWVADTAVELAKAQQMTRSLDFSMKRTNQGILPDAAFGPPGRLDARGVSQGDTNVSVIRSEQLGQGFSLAAIMKSPTEGATGLLEKSIAPEGSGRKATLLDALEANGVYQFSYRVDRQQGAPPLQAISILAEKNGVLFTTTVVAPEDDWAGSFGIKLQKIASSFHLR